jgi:hypothetical protein
MKKYIVLLIVLLGAADIANAEECGEKQVKIKTLKGISLGHLEIMFQVSGEAIKQANGGKALLKADGWLCIPISSREIDAVAVEKDFWYTAYSQENANYRGAREKFEDFKTDLGQQLLMNDLYKYFSWLLFFVSIYMIYRVRALKRKRRRSSKYGWA